jgi:hypothetical protein
MKIFPGLYKKLKKLSSNIYVEDEVCISKWMDFVIAIVICCGTQVIPWSQSQP